MEGREPLSALGQNSSWEIYKDVLEPKSSHRPIRAWERAPVTAHTPRLLGQKIWKRAGLRSDKNKANVDLAQVELEREGKGARKRLRKAGDKENMMIAPWVSQHAVGEHDPPVGDFGLGKELDSTALAGVEGSNVALIPRKRTHTNHIITPRKSSRNMSKNRELMVGADQSEIDQHLEQSLQLKPEGRRISQPATEYPRRRLSMRRSLRRHTLAIAVNDNPKTLDDPALPETVGYGLEKSVKNFENTPEEALQDASLVNTQFPKDSDQSPTVPSIIDSPRTDRSTESTIVQNHGDEALVFKSQESSQPDLNEAQGTAGKPIIDVNEEQQEGSRCADPRLNDFTHEITSIVSFEESAAIGVPSPARVEEGQRSRGGPTSKVVKSILSPQGPRRSSRRSSTDAPQNQNGPTKQCDSIDLERVVTTPVAKIDDQIVKDEILTRTADRPEEISNLSEERIASLKEVNVNHDALHLINIQNSLPLISAPETQRHSVTIGDQHVRQECADIGLAVSVEHELILRAVQDIPSTAHTHDAEMPGSTGVEKQVNDFASQDHDSADHSKITGTSLVELHDDSVPLQHGIHMQPISQMNSESSSDPLKFSEPFASPPAQQVTVDDLVDELSEDFQETSTPDPSTTQLIETISINASPAKQDSSDTDMLRNFVFKVKANKAAKASVPVTKRKRSLPHSPIQVPLGTEDDLLPSALEQRDEVEDDHSKDSPVKRRKGTGVSKEDNDLTEPRSIRRSRRTRMPVKAAPLAAPSFIPVRRLGQDGDNTITVLRNEEKELAALTRINTRKNRGGAVHPQELLKKRAEEKDDPVARQRMLKEIFDEKAKQQGKKRKSVVWAEQLAQFQTTTGKEVEKARVVEKDELPATETKAALKVGVSSKKALGMTGNGTPAQKVRAKRRL